MAALERDADAGHASDPDAEPLKVSDLLDRGWRTFEELDSTHEPLASAGVQARVRRGLRMLEEASGMVAQLDLFSSNEELEEVATADLKYLLLPALLGGLTLKRAGRAGRAGRLELVRTARAYFMDFLRRCKEYKLAQFELPTSREGADGASRGGGPTATPASSDLVSLAAKRQAKIERFRQKKELERRLSDVKRAVDGGQADDEVCRDFYLLNVKRWIALSLEEVESIEQEVEILDKMDAPKPGGALQPEPPGRPAFKPFVLTKDQVQAQVFGAGYPSLPTMTVDDWYDQHRKRGVLPDQGVPGTAGEGADAQEGQEEEKEETEESLQKARGWDDWKDTHRRGYGNRHNMG
ncbi:immunoglobulin-binding protein 1 [Brachionichthys hirsutus]|uniref:immunoglobulin-binding protein 1 n=1 Tax=Brachionichthys hirsutus TaxID=412623 RepID=UPI003604A2C1